jgi:6-phosphogluconolactonase (cycloisomerase 2 family)
MNYEKALSLYRNDKTLQLLRAEHFPLLVGFFHLAFRQQDKISYIQSELQSLLADYIYSLERQRINDYGGLVRL